MSLEWKTLEIPLHHAKEVIKTYGQETERIFTNGPAKAGKYYSYEGAAIKYDIYSLYLYFENIPQWLKTCYVKGAYVDHITDNNNFIEIRYEKEEEKWVEKRKLSRPSQGVPGSTIYTGADNEPLLRDVLPNNRVGGLTDTTEYILQKILTNGNVTEEVKGYTTDTDYEYIRTEVLCEMKDVSQVKLIIVYAQASVDVAPIYPVDVYFKNTKPLEISWASRIEVYREPSWDSVLYKKSNDVLYISNSKIELWNDNGVRAEHILESSTNIYTVSLSELTSFGVGNLYYKITSTTNDNVEGYTTGKCVLIGETNAPDITGHINDSFPTISWNCDNQAAWQMIVKQGENVFLDTGIKPGNVQEYKLPILLDDGNYSVEIRAVNTVGVYTGWSSYLMVLSTVKPSAPDGIIVSANNKFGITVKCNIPSDAGTLFVMRRRDSLSKAEIVGEYIENFTDYKIELNESYEYTVRNYVEGCSDGAWVDAVVNAEGVVIRKANDFVHLFMAETEFDVIKADERDDTLSKCVGRTFPVLEIGEWITSTRRAGGCVSNDDYKLLVEMSLNGSVMLQSNKEVIPCYMRVADMGKHVSGGRLVELVFTRIDGE